MKKKHTQSGPFTPNAAMSLMHRINSGHRVALTPRESTIKTMDEAVNNCRSLVGLVSATGALLRREDVLAVGQDNTDLKRSANALRKDLMQFNAELQALEAQAAATKEIKSDLDFLAQSANVCVALNDWQEKFSNVVLPLNGQVHDICLELVEPKEPVNE